MRQYWNAESNDFLISRNFEMLSNTLLVNRNLITGSYFIYYYYRPALSVIQGFTVFGHTSLITFGEPKNGLDSGALLSMVKLVLNISIFS